MSCIHLAVCPPSFPNRCFVLHLKWGIIYDSISVQQSSSCDRMKRYFLYRIYYSIERQHESHRDTRVQIWISFTLMNELNTFDGDYARICSTKNEKCMHNYGITTLRTYFLCYLIQPKVFLFFNSKDFSMWITIRSLSFYLIGWY